VDLLSDLKNLIPHKSVDIYGHKVDIYPLTLSELGKVISKLQSHVSKLNKLGITLESLSSSDPNYSKNLLTLFTYLITNCPDILTDITKIDVKVFEKLPVDKSLEIILAVLDLNFESKDTLLKNLNRLIEMIPIDQKVENQSITT